MRVPPQSKAVACWPWAAAPLFRVRIFKVYRFFEFDNVLKLVSFLSFKVLEFGKGREIWNFKLSSNVFPTNCWYVLRILRSNFIARHFHKCSFYASFHSKVLQFCKSKHLSYASDGLQHLARTFPLKLYRVSILTSENQKLPSSIA